MKHIYIVMLSMVFMVQYTGCHEYKLNFHTEQQAIHISKGNDQTEVHFGDILDIGNNRKIVYVGNEMWREKDKANSKHWPNKLHHFTAEDMDAWPQAIKTGFEVVDDQLNSDEGDLDTASAHDINDNYYAEDDTHKQMNLQTKSAMLVAFIVLLCCVGTVCIGGMIRIGCTAISSRSQPSKDNARDRFGFKMYRRLPVQAVNVSDVTEDEHLVQVIP
eukprot:329710_1